MHLVYRKTFKNVACFFWGGVLLCRAGGVYSIMAHAGLWVMGLRVVLCTC